MCQRPPPNFPCIHTRSTMWIAEKCNRKYNFLLLTIEEKNRDGIFFKFLCSFSVLHQLAFSGLPLKPLDARSLADQSWVGLLEALRPPTPPPPPSSTRMSTKPAGPSDTSGLTGTGVGRKQNYTNIHPITSNNTVIGVVLSCMNACAMCEFSK